MLFCKYIDPCCDYCRSGRRISPTEVMCLRRGVVSAGGFCKKFDYDPFKREPARPVLLNASAFKQEDFEL